MSEQQLTYEGILEMIRESSRKSDRDIQKTRRLMKKRDAEFDRRMQKTELQMERTSKEVGKLGNRIGDIVEHMLGARIIDKFQALGYDIKDCTRNHYFEISKLGIRGEIDLILHDGDISILIEVKTSLETADVRKHLEQIAKFRIYADARWKDPPRFIGAVAGAVVDDDAKDFAHESGLYTIVQSGEGVEIVSVPEDFRAKEW